MLPKDLKETALSKLLFLTAHNISS